MLMYDYVQQYVYYIYIYVYTHMLYGPRYGFPATYPVNIFLEFDCLVPYSFKNGLVDVATPTSIVWTTEYCMICIF